MYKGLGAILFLFVEKFLKKCSYQLYYANTEIEGAFCQGHQCQSWISTNSQCLWGHIFISLEMFNICFRKKERNQKHIPSSQATVSDWARTRNPGLFDSTETRREIIFIISRTSATAVGRTWTEISKKKIIKTNGSTLTAMHLTGINWAHAMYQACARGIHMQ